MKNIFRISFILILVALLTLLLTGVASATQPEFAIFDFDLILTGPDSAAGTFVATGAVEDCGLAHQVFWYTDDGNVRGIKTSADQQTGNIFHCQVLNAFNALLKQSIGLPEIEPIDLLLQVRWFEKIG